MRLILFRHGHKQFSMDDNPSLSDRGHKQADHLLEKVEKKELPQPTLCWFSPRKRTFETLAQLKKFTPIQWEQKTALGEKNLNESYHDFKQRISKIFSEIEKKSQNSKPEDTIFLCTHYDWIETALTVIHSDQDLTGFEFSNWSPGQFIEFDYYDNLFHFIKKGAL